MHTVSIIIQTGRPRQSVSSQLPAGGDWCWGLWLGGEALEDEGSYTMDLREPRRVQRYLLPAGFD